MNPDIKEKIETENEQEVQRPRRYKVIFHNDDYTPMDFVIEVLMLFFNKSPQAAIAITEEVHFKGKSVVAIYPKNIAQMKVKQVIEAAQANEYPLNCSMEAE
jgi:ATP-dependent Clp protease adaptor protein ClpS